MPTGLFNGNGAPGRAAIYFRKVQRFRQPWYWAILIPALAAIGYIEYRKNFAGQTLGWPSGLQCVSDHHRPQRPRCS